MDLFTVPPFSTALSTVYHALTALADLLAPVAGTGAPALAVVAATLFVRAALIPAGIAGARAEQSRARLAPDIAQLRERWKGQPERLQREIVELYRRHGVSPIAGCLPAVTQAPVFGILYAVFVHADIAGEANLLLSGRLFGASLGTTVVGALGDPATLLVFAVLAILVAVIAEFSRRTAAISVPPGMPPGPTRLAGALHFAPLVAVAVLPLAAGVYLCVSLAWTLAQRAVLRRCYPIA
ncbi:YidC/Oxa1 family membrane protein insertase [Microbacterium sp. MTN4-26]|uniref:YidC/Oxa1 family membrane protein insertase n=1 Tax=unclassified Microbacterium TaxID=2609290 RepID=UPI0036F1EF5C